MAIIISEELARKDVLSWLEYHSIDPDTIEEQKESVKKLINAVVNGFLVVNEDKSLSYKLKIPTETIKELKFKNRVTRKDLLPYLEGVKPTDMDRRMLAYGAALTGIGKAELSMLENVDQKICDSIVLFFII